MAQTDFRSVDEYIASQPEAAQGLLERVRSTIRKAVPGAEEAISYKMPTYKLHGVTMLGFAGGGSTIRSTAPPVTSSRRSRTTLLPYEVDKGTSAFRSPSPSP